MVLRHLSVLAIQIVAGHVKVLFVVLRERSAVDGELVVLLSDLIGILALPFHFAGIKRHHVNAEDCVGHLHRALPLRDLQHRGQCLFVFVAVLLIRHRHFGGTELQERPFVGVEFDFLLILSVADLRLEVDLQVNADLKEERTHDALVRSLSGFPGVIHVQETVQFCVEADFRGNADGVELRADETHARVEFNAGPDAEHAEHEEVDAEVGLLVIIIALFRFTGQTLDVITEFPAVAVRKAEADHGIDLEGDLHARADAELDEVERIRRCRQVEQFELHQIDVLGVVVEHFRILGRQIAACARPLRSVVVVGLFLLCGILTALGNGAAFLDRGNGVGHLADRLAHVQEGIRVALI